MFQKIVKLSEVASGFRGGTEEPKSEQAKQTPQSALKSVKEEEEKVKSNTQHLTNRWLDRHTHRSQHRN